MKIYFYTLLSLFLFSCKNSKISDPITASPVSTTAAKTLDAKRSNLPPLTLDIIKKMLAEVDYIDYIMHELPFSLSQDTKADINANIMFISNTPVGDVPASCKPIGRKFYNIKGETYLAADIYFSEGCSFYIFLDGEKPLYSAMFTKEGYNFYTQIVAQGSKATQPPSN